MKITKVSYQKTYSIGPYLTDRVGFEADLGDNESCTEALAQLRKEADDWHIKTNPHSYQESESMRGQIIRETIKGAAQSSLPIGPPAPMQIEKDNPEDILDLIQNAPSLEVLKTFKVLASSDPSKVLYNAYNKRLKELSQ